MKIAVLLMMLMALGTQASEQKRFIALNRLWQDIHSKAFRENAEPNAVLVVDPSKSAIWIDRGVTVPPAETENLPQGLEWSAFHLTEKGIREIKFPVRLLRPRLETEIEEASETIFIFGFGKDIDWRFAFTPKPTGHQFNAGYVGSGSKMTSMNITLPQVNDSGTVSPQSDSILLPDGHEPNKWSDTIHTKNFTINIERKSKL